MDGAAGKVQPPFQVDTQKPLKGRRIESKLRRAFDTMITEALWFGHRRRRGRSSDSTWALSTAELDADLPVSYIRDSPIIDTARNGTAVQNVATHAQPGARGVVPAAPTTMCADLVCLLIEIQNASGSRRRGSEI